VQGCIKCHTTDADEAPKAPYLGDAGAKYDRNYFVTSILRPSAQIAQGFQTVQVQVSGTDGPMIYIGFPVKESADELTLRDITGKVTVIKKSTITARTTLPQSIMPEGLTNSMTLDDFHALIAYLRSLK
jgi:putative heme-binding domain-containing protein